VLLHDPKPPALVTCRDCHFTWHSPTMARGLRLAGACVRCGGELAFSDDVLPDEAESDSELDRLRRVEPHQALGRPEIG
jgi:hypothetical protein